MPLTSFGSILTFAEEIEKQDIEFYSDALNNPEAKELKALIEQFTKEGKKNITLIQRTRRENVTEMILEPVTDFVREPFLIEKQDAGNMDSGKILEAVKTVEQRSIDYYTKASAKMKALPEVSNALKLLAKKHNNRMKKL